MEDMKFIASNGARSDICSIRYMSTGINFLTKKNSQSGRNCLSTDVTHSSAL